MSRAASVIGWANPDPPPSPAPPIVPLWLVDFRMRMAGKWDAMQAVLAAQPEARDRLLGLHEGIYADDADARALIQAAGADPAVILAIPTTA